MTTPKAPEAAVARVQEALTRSLNIVGPMRRIFQDEEMADALAVLLAQEIEVAAVAAADAAVAPIAAQTLRDAYRELREAAWDVRTHGDAYAILLARADRIEAS